MILKTKSYKLSKATYMRVAFLHILKKQWWVMALLGGAAVGLLAFQKYTWSLLPLVGLGLYLLFWAVQFYGVTVLESNQILFQPLRYQISSKEILLLLTAKQGMPIRWKQVEEAYVGKNVCILFLSKAQFLYLPYHLLKGAQEKSFLLFLLKSHHLI